MTEPEPDWTWRAVAIAVGIAFAGLGMDAARKETPTIDEFAHVPSGAAILEHGRTDLYPNNPPLFRVLLALPVVAAGANVPPVDVPVRDWGPWSYGTVFQEHNPDGYLRYYTLARSVTVLFGLLAGALLFLWARSLAGERSAAIVTGLFLLSPTVLAHSHLATIDTACTFTFAASVFVFGWSERTPSHGRTLAAGLVWGIALLTKFTAILLIPAWLTLALMRGDGRGAAFVRLLWMTLAALLTINLAMGFAGSFTPLGDFEFASGFAKSIQGLLPAWLPVPLPADYLIGFDLQKQDTEMGELGSYLLGEWSLVGWWYYNFVAFGVKVPLPTLVVLAVSLVHLRRVKHPELRLVWVPLCWLLFILCFANRLNIGIRYLLPAFPFLFLCTAPWFGHLKPRLAIAVGGALLALYLGTALWVHPGYIAYFNPLARGRGERILADSNLDIGQDLYLLPSALTQLDAKQPPYLLYFGHVHPRAYGITYRDVPSKPVQGIVAASVGYVLGMTYVAPRSDGAAFWVHDRDHLAWLRDRPPTLKAGTIWVWDLR